VALQPLHAAATLTRVFVSTYEAVSGAGQAGVDELESQSRALFAMGEVEPKQFPHRIAFNLIPGLGEGSVNGYTADELALADESRKVLGLPDLAVSATCVRVPVFYCHSEAVTATFARDLTPEDARALLRKAPGVKVVDDLATNVYPMPLLGAGDDDTLVGRIRRDLADARALSLFVVGDNVRKGAATNAVQIAEALLRDHRGAFGPR
jgi:aspartate-semialdehyde dehydrogenase